MEIKTININKELQQISNAAAFALQKQLNSEGLGSSNLFNAIEYNVKDTVLTINIPGYGIYVDEGTKPHMPPVSAIEEWAEPKGLNVWAVAKNIEMYGTEAQPFLFAADKVMDDSFDKIADAGLNDIAAVTDEMFKETGAELK